MKKCLIVHVPYQVRGGEDVAVEAQARALQALGYDVVLWPQNRKPPALSLSSSIESLKPSRHWRGLEQELEMLQPEFVLLNHIYPLYGPRFLRALQRRKIPVFWVVHNHRLYCANGLAMLRGRVCRDCKNKKPWRALARDCNGNLARSAYYSLALGQLRSPARGKSLLSGVRSFIAPSPYMSAEIESLGVPREKVRWIVNPVLDADEAFSGVSLEASGNSDVFFGSRLSPEKGISTFLKAIERLPQIQFSIAGDGELKPLVQEAAGRLNNLRYLGARPRTEVLASIHRSKIAVLPSQCNETLPTSVLEAFTQGKRCVIPDMESTRWLAEKPFFGVLTNTFDPISIAETIQKTLAMPVPTEAETEQLRRFFGFERYKNSLSELLQSACKPLAASLA